MELIPMNKIWQFTGFLCKEMDILKIQPHKSVSSRFPWYFTAKDKFKVILDNYLWHESICIFRYLD